VSDETPSAPGGFTVGSQIAGYRLEAQIGQGGMAVVFRAHDDRLDRLVALKILAPGLALDDAFRQRFIRESRTAAAVDDPHIIPVFDAGEAGGVLFIAMRFVRGGDVRTLLDRVGPLPPARATEIISQVASALDAAHAHGLVHRDVKPANMLLDARAGDDRPYHVYLSDFGLSKQSLAPSGLTSTGQFLGTLDYVAPEQIEGRQVDGRADLYALACAAFELLSGAPPFRRDQGLAVVYAQLSEPPPSLAARRSDLPAGIDRVMAKALAKSPADRYRTCWDFAAALRGVFGLQPVDLGPAGAPPERPRTEIAMPVARATAQPPEDQASAPPRPPTEASLPVAGPASAGPPAAGPPTEASLPVAGPPTEASLPVAGPPTEASLPVAGSASASPPSPAHGRAGPPTQAAGFPVPRSTTPGLTEPPSGRGGQGLDSGYAERGRPRRRSRGVLAAAAAVAVLVIAGGAFALLHHSGGGGGSGGGGKGAAVPPPAIPGCTTAIAKATSLRTVRSASVQLTGNPFAVKVSRDGRYSFVTLGNSVAVLSNAGGLAPKLVRTVGVPGAKKGEAITKNGYLLVAVGSGAAVLSVAEAEQGAANPVVGTLTSPHGHGAVQVATSPDDRFVFVTLQSSNEMAVFNLQKALSSGFGPSDFIGDVPLGDEPVGISVSGDWLYATSLQASAGPSPAEGTISVVSMAKAETKPATAVVAKATAGCGAARVITSSDGSVVWVTARQSDSLLGFSAAKLRSDPAHSLIALVPVGANPIGLTFVNGGNRIIVADSDMSQLIGGASDLAVVSTAEAQARKPALLGVIPSGQLPRQFTTEPNGKTLLVTVYTSHQLQAIPVADIP
jgi:serine/threonine-protein kinase